MILSNAYVQASVLLLTICVVCSNVGFIHLSTFLFQGNWWAKPYATLDRRGKKSDVVL